MIEKEHTESESLSMVDLTVAICTYNGAKRLPQVLDHLKAQTFSQPVSWEVIVIDNNSQDGTEHVVKDYQQSWLPQVSLKYCYEPKQGLAFARQHAVEAAAGNLVGFIDDDNLPAADWIDQAYTFAQRHPQAGVFGSRVIGRYDSKPPKDFHRISRFLAIGGGPSEVCYSSYPYAAVNKHVYPPGAGAVVKRQVWLENVPSRLTLQGYVSGLNLPGEDVEAFSYLRQANWEIWYNPAMKIEHHIPSTRLNKSYLLDLMWRVGLSRYYTRYLRVSNWLWPLVALAFWLNDLRKLFQHWLVYGRTGSNIVVACERQLILGSLISPFIRVRPTLAPFKTGFNSSAPASH